MLLVLTCVASMLATPVRSQQPERLALVIGNSIYENGPDLRNPVNDARAVAAELSRLGYRVYHGENLNNADMSRLLLGFADKITEARQVVVYFAGHGVQIDGVTYLMPTDAVMRSKDDLITAITLNEVLDLLRGDLRASIVLVDACRDNPIYENAATRSFAGGGGSQNRALFDLPYGMLIGYASRPGAVAYDGPLQHSPYAAALLDHMATPGLDVELMLRRVRNQVVQITEGAQVPWTQSSLLGEVRLAPDIALPTASGPERDPHPLARSATRQTLPVSSTIAPAKGPSSPAAVIDAINVDPQLKQRLVKALCSALQPPLPHQCKLP